MMKEEARVERKPKSLPEYQMARNGMSSSSISRICHHAR
jgi:hypothetical protein